MFGYKKAVKEIVLMMELFYALTILILTTRLQYDVTMVLDGVTIGKLVKGAWDLSVISYNCMQICNFFFKIKSLLKHMIYE